MTFNLNNYYKKKTILQTQFKIKIKGEIIIEKSVKLENKNDHNGMLLNFSQDKTHKQYILYFDEGTDGKIRLFCECFSIELNTFVVNTVKSYLYEIGDDLGDGDYDTIGKYYDVSKLVGVQHITYPIRNLKKIKKLKQNFLY